MAVVVAKSKSGAWAPRWTPGDPPTVPFVRGSGGLIATATDFAGFCRLWLDDGRCGDRILLSPSATAAATRSQTDHIAGTRYGFGWTIEQNGVFSHGGSDGT
jgi:CubicO group peptidase (beta-lactamase class C family)